MTRVPTTCHCEQICYFDTLNTCKQVWIQRSGLRITSLTSSRLRHSSVRPCARVRRMNLLISSSCHISAYLWCQNVWSGSGEHHPGRTGFRRFFPAIVVAENAWRHMTFHFERLQARLNIMESSWFCVHSSWRDWTVFSRSCPDLSCLHLVIIVCTCVWFCSHLFLVISFFFFFLLVSWIEPFVLCFLSAFNLVS